MKNDFEKFLGEPEDWNAWSNIYMLKGVYMAHIFALRCEDVPTIPAVQDVNVGAKNFDGSQVHP